MDSPLRKAMQGMLSKQWLLRCHILLGLRWCFVPLTVLLLSGSVLVACHHPPQLESVNSVKLDPSI